MSNKIENFEPIKVGTYNVRGLGDSKKRVAIFRKLKRYDVVFLQETYNYEPKDFDYACHLQSIFDINYTKGTSHQGGVMTLTKKQNVKKLTEIEVIEGRILSSIAYYKGKKLGLINCYAPCVQKSKELLKNYSNFANNLKKLAKNSKAGTDELIIAGDFNIIMDSNKDAWGGNPNVITEIKNLFFNLMALYFSLNTT